MSGKGSNKKWFVIGGAVVALALAAVLLRKKIFRTGEDGKDAGKNAGKGPMVAGRNINNSKNKQSDDVYSIMSGNWYEAIRPTKMFKYHFGRVGGSLREDVRDVKVGEKISGFYETKSYDDKPWVKVMPSGQFWDSKRGPETLYVDAEDLKRTGPLAIS